MQTKLDALRLSLASVASLRADLAAALATVTALRKRAAVLVEGVTTASQEILAASNAQMDAGTVHDESTMESLYALEALVTPDVLVLAGAEDVIGEVLASLGDLEGTLATV